MRLYLAILVLTKVVDSGNISVDCVFDPVDKKYVSICPSSSENTCEKSGSDMIYDELKRVFKEKLDKQFLKDDLSKKEALASKYDENDEQNTENPENLENPENTDNPDNHDSESSNWEVKIKIPRNFVIDDILRVIVAEIEKVELPLETYNETDPELNESDSDSDFSENTVFNKFSNYFSSKELYSLLTTPKLGPEVVPIAVILIGSLVYYKILAINFVLFVFVCTSYIQTYLEQIEKFNNKQFTMFTSSQNHNTQKSIFSWSFFSKTTENEFNSVSNQSLRPLTVFFIMVSETFCEPMIIFSRTLKDVVVAGFSDLNFFLWPVMLIVFSVAGMFFMYGLLFMFGLELNFRLLGGLLADCKIKKSEAKAVREKNDGNSVSREDLMMICERMERMSMKFQEKSERINLNSQKMLTDSKIKKVVIDDKIDDNITENKPDFCVETVKKPVKNEIISHIGNGDFTIKQESVKISEIGKQSVIDSE